MDTKQIAPQFAQRAGIEVKVASVMLEALGNVIAESCGNLDTIAVPGFGNFTASKRNEYISENEVTGEKTLIPPSITVEFRPSVVLRNRLSR